MNTRRRLVLALGAGGLAAPLASFAQQNPPKVARIGYLDATSASASASRVEALREGLRALGYVEGKNIVIEYRWAEAKYERLPALAVFMLITSSNLVARSIGKSLGFVPLRILSTK